MAILDGDIKILKSEVMDDVPEGGGMSTGIAVVDGESNNIFPDISELDRTYGRVSLRKFFPALVTDNTDVYYGANLIVATPPADEKVSVALFSTGSWFDHRTDAQNALESYLSASAEGRWSLYGNHLAGQRTVQMHCARSATTPSVDDVLMLISASDSTKYQYVRISRLIGREENVIFEDSKGSFNRDLITVEISDALRYNFSAGTMERYTADWFTPPTRIHTTIAADAATYYGVAPLKIAAALGDLTISAKSIYTQLVPSALAETPIIDARCTSDRVVIVPIAGAASITFTRSLTAAAGVGVVIYFGQAIARGSLSVALAGITLVDDGNGSIVPNTGFTGEVDYEVGVAIIARATGLAGVQASFSAAPACAVATAGHSTSTSITPANRAYTYVKTLSPPPAPGSVAISYRAQNEWYTLYDDAAGGLSAVEGTGAGSVDYATGSMRLTLGALPDADTQIIFAWGSPAHYESHVGNAVFSAPSIKFSIPGGAVEPGTLAIRYIAAGVEKTVNDNSSGGLNGAGAGYIDYAVGAGVLRPSLLPDSGTSLVISYRQGGKVVEVFPAAGAVTAFSLAGAAEPKSLSLVVVDAAGIKHTIGDNGAGALILLSSDRAEVSAALMTTKLVSAAGVAGSINYATGAVSLGVSVTVLQQYQTGYTWSSMSTTAVAVGAITATYRPAGDVVGEVQNLSISLPALQLDLLPTVTNTLMPGGVRFTLAGHTYVDRSGSLVKDPDSATNSGVVAGSINYASGIATLTDYAGGGQPVIVVAALTRRGTWTDWQIMFRTAGSPLQSASLYVAALRADTGAQISGTAGSDGYLDGAFVDGSVDITTGIVSVRFGQWVAAAGKEAEWWYEAENVSGGQIFQPLMVMPETAKYNAVAVNTLPLDADILGLDPVRLPVDGRVPIFRKSGVVVVHHTAQTSPQVVSNGQVIDVGRVRLAKLRVIGNDGLKINAGYTHDLDAGTVTFTNVSGYSQPVIVEHRIEDMAVLADVQINGDLRINRRLTHNFPLGSFVSSALVIRDMHARVPVIFDQQAWSGWYDVQQGSAATGTYNKAQYPVLVSNRGAINERWEIVFTNTTTVSVIGETVGQIATGVPIANVIAPLNPATGTPYFSLDPLGWGQGWAAGNVLRINTIGAQYPVWCARTVLQGNPTTNNDHFTLAVRGDIDS